MIVNDTDFTPKYIAAAAKKVFLLYGDERYTKELSLKRIIKNYEIDTKNDFNYTVINPEGEGIKNIDDALSAVPLFAEYKCVIVKGYNTETSNPETNKKIISAVNNAPLDTIFVITTNEIVNKKRDDKFNALLEAVNKVGIAVTCIKKSPYKTTAFIREYAKKRNCIITPKAQDLLCEQTGCDKALIVTELDKLTAYHGYVPDSEITEQDVLKLSSKALEGMIFKLCDDIAANNYKQAYKRLDTLLMVGEPVSAILNQIASNFIDIYRVKALPKGEDPTRISSKFNYKGKEFRLKNSISVASGFSVSQLKKIINIITEFASGQRASMYSNERECLEQMLCEIFMQRRV